MSLQVRRVVTGHDANGKAIVLKDEISTNIRNNRPGCQSAVLWSTEGFPVNNDGDHDPTGKQLGTTEENGTVFRVVRYEPGVTPRNHRTDSIDYAVVVQGTIDMEMDDGLVVPLKQGDTLIQRGTVHNWVNSSNEVCIIAFVLVSADPVKINGKPLPAHG